MHQHLNSNVQIGIPEEQEKKKGFEKIPEEIIVEHFPNTEKEKSINPRGTKSPIQDKPKGETGQDTY